MPDAVRLDLLRQLREDAGLTQAEMARLCGLRGRQSHQTAGAWERGEYAPDERRRPAFIAYLWDSLGLRRTPARFAQVWAMLEEEWDWAAIDDVEWRRFSQLPRPAPVPAAPASPPAPFQAPAAAAHFVGRDELAGRLAQQLASGAAPRVVALTGMGGIGKTALAIHLAHRLVGAFPDGVLWAYSAASEPRDVAVSWAQAYGYQFAGLADLHSVAAALRGVLAPKRVLLVIDDVTAPARVQPLLPGGDHAAVILTTRSADVAAALGAAIVPVDELGLDEAVALLVRLLGGTRVAAEEAPARAICRMLQGLPLAVEIVGQLMAIRSQRPLATMAQRLADAEQRLELQISDRAVRTSFAVSWDALDAGHRHVFACMGAFAGRSFAAPALAAVAEVDLATAQDRLDTLGARSLVTVEAGGRYRQHPLLADFARERLGEATGPWLRMAGHFGAYASSHAQDLPKLHAEWENLAAAMEFAYARQQWKLVVDYGDALTEAWFAGAYYTEARTGYLRQCEAAAALGDGDAEARGYLRWGRACLEQDAYGEAGGLLEMALTAFHKLEDEAGVAEAHTWLARMALERSRYDEAGSHIAVCQQLYAQLGDSRGLAITMYQEALAIYDRSEWDQAMALCETALALQRTCGDWQGEVATLRLMADIAIERTDYDAAHRNCQAALEICQARNDQGELAAIYYNMAVVARMRGDLEEAMAYAEQAGTRLYRLGVRGFYALVLYEQSRIRLRQDALPEARQLAESSVQQLKSLQITFTLIYALHQLGVIEAKLGEPQHALAHWEQALGAMEAQPHPLRDEITTLIAAHAQVPRGAMAPERNAAV